jgi:hypothetical protein
MLPDMTTDATVTQLRRVWFPFAPLPASIFAAVILLMASAFVVGQTLLLRVDWWWADELFTIWATAPDQSFSSFWQRVAPDPTPPLYYLTLYSLRRFIDLPIQNLRLETFGLNLGFMMATAIIVAAASRRANITRLGLWGIGAFFLSGCAFNFAPEARAYCLALCVVFVAAWGAAITVTRADAGWSWRRFVALGVIAAFIHAFAAIACGALAAGVMAAGLTERRRNLVPPGLALGLAAVLGCIARVLIAGPTQAIFAPDWITFTPHDVYVAANTVGQIEIGGWFAGAILAIMLGSAFFCRQTSGLASCFLVALGAFFVLPIMASLIHPMFVGRYLLIGGPLLLVFIIFLAGAGQNAARTAMPLVFTGGAIAFLSLSSLSGFANAYALTRSKPGWFGADLVTSLAVGCTAHSIHVSGRIGNPAGSGVYALFVPLPVDLFVNATLATTPWLRAADDACPVLGWAEHVSKSDDPGYPANASDDELLAQLKISAEPGTVEIQRHAYGYVVLKAMSRQ